MSAGKSVIVRVCLRRSDSGAHRLRLGCRRPGEESERALHAGEFAVQLDIVALRALQGDPAAYGAALGAMLFAEPDAQEAWARACGLAEADAGRLRVSLDLDADDPALGLWWECLRDPLDRQPASDQRTSLSRALATGEVGAARVLRRRPRLLVAVANPAGLDAYQLSPLDRPALLEWVAPLRARVDCQELPRASLAALVAALRGGCDVLFLACHGSHRGGGTVLWLESGDGTIDRVASEELVAAIRALRERPRLVVLTICHGSGRGDVEDVSGALGPALAAAGVAFVVAAQGLLAVDTAARMLPVVLAGAFAHGDVDAALVEARAVAQERPDWWSLALFTRTPEAPLWRSVRPLPRLPRRWLAGAAIGGLAVAVAVHTLSGPPPPVLVCANTGGEVAAKLIIRVTLAGSDPVTLPASCLHFTAEATPPDLPALLAAVDRFAAQSGRPFPQRELLARDGVRSLRVDAGALARPLAVQLQVAHPERRPGASAIPGQFITCPLENACLTDEVCLLSVCRPRRP